MPPQIPSCNRLRLFRSSFSLSAFIIACAGHLYEKVSDTGGPGDFLVLGSARWGGARRAGCTVDNPYRPEGCAQAAGSGSKLCLIAYGIPACTPCSSRRFPSQLPFLRVRGRLHFLPVASDPHGLLVDSRIVHRRFARNSTTLPPATHLFLSSYLSSSVCGH